MNYEGFIHYVKTKIQKEMTDEVHIELHQVTKNNGVMKDGLTIMAKGGNISPTIYLNEYYNSYQDGATISDIMKDILDIYTQNKKSIQLDTEFYKNFENAKKHVACKLVNFEKNKELLQKIPHMRYLDLAIVFYYIMKNDAIGNGSILIYNNHLEKWGISKERLYETARKNTLLLLPYEFQSMQEVLKEALGEIEMKPENDDIPMYVLSNQEKNMGAICILYDTILFEIGTILEEDYYILPSSIHECIIVPESVETAKEELIAMVREINETQVLPEEILSDNIYHYERKEHRLSTF